MGAACERRRGAPSAPTHPAPSLDCPSARRELAGTIPGLEVVGGEAAAISPLVHLRLHPAPPPAEVRAGRWARARLFHSFIRRLAPIVHSAARSRPLLPHTLHSPKPLSSSPPPTSPPLPPPPWPQYVAGDELLQRLAADCLDRQGVLLAVARYSKLERARPPPSIRCACALVSALVVALVWDVAARATGRESAIVCDATPCRGGIKHTTTALAPLRLAPWQGGRHRGAHARRPAKGGGRHQGVRAARAQGQVNQRLRHRRWRRRGALSAARHAGGASLRAAPAAAPEE